MEAPIADASLICSLSVFSLINKFRESFINSLVDFFFASSNVHSLINVFLLKKKGLKVLRVGVKGLFVEVYFYQILMKKN